MQAGPEADKSGARGRKGNPESSVPPSEGPATCMRAAVEPEVWRVFCRGRTDPKEK